MSHGVRTGKCAGHKEQLFFPQKCYVRQSLDLLAMLAAALS